MLFANALKESAEKRWGSVDKLQIAVTLGISLATAYRWCTGKASPTTAHFESFHEPWPELVQAYLKAARKAFRK